MGQRLQVDAHVVGYWGFDEANQDDIAIDESSYVRDLTVVTAIGVAPARVGNGRIFDGSTTYAYPADSAPYRLVDSHSIIVWIIINSMNQSGDLLRPIVSCDGAGGTTADNTLYALSVDNAGRVVYRFDRNAGEPTVFRTAAGVIKTNRYYSLALARSVSGGLASVTLFIDNQPEPWASVTVNGVTQGDPAAAVAAPNTTGSTAELRVGASLKSSSKLDGVVDELSLHDVARAYASYFKDAYFSITRSLAFTRITNHGDIRTVGSAEMGGGSRWWVYERAGSLYAIRENSLGLFSQEVWLTTAGTLPSGVASPAGVEQPRLAYDPVSDVLLIVFVGGGRVFKITAKSSDAPSTQNMPLTQDTGSILKASDAYDISRIGVGSPMASGDGVGRDVNSDTLSAPTLVFVDVPSFGIAVVGSNSYGYALYRTIAGVEQFLGYAKGTKNSQRGGMTDWYWFIPVASRVPWAAYRAFPLTSKGGISLNGSNMLYDYSSDMFELTPARLVYNLNGEAPDDILAPGAGGPVQVQDGLVLVNRQPVKMQVVDADSLKIGSGDSSQIPVPAFVNRQPIKLFATDADALTAGAGGPVSLTMRGTNRTRVE